jgi:hypothetical protein
MNELTVEGARFVKLAAEWVSLALDTYEGYGGPSELVGKDVWLGLQALHDGNDEALEQALARIEARNR